MWYLCGVSDGLEKTEETGEAEEVIECRRCRALEMVGQGSAWLVEKKRVLEV